MKKVFSIVVLLAIVALALTACTAQGFVGLPDDVQTGINMVAVLLIGYAFAYVVALVPFLSFLEQFKLPLAAAVSAQLISFLQVSVPDQYGDIAIHGLRLLLAVVALLMAGVQLKRQGAIK